MDPKPKAFVLLSGGIDSSTCLFKAIKEHGREFVQAISVDYGQRHIKETEQARKICNFAMVDHRVVQMAPPPKSMLTDASADVPSISYGEITGVSPTYVPFRNGQLLSRIAGIAQAEGDNPCLIYTGVHAEDALNWAYPDCTPEFIGAMANAIYIGTYHQVRLLAPLQSMMKDEIVELGTKLGVPWELTWSCYKGEELHCGECPTCRARHDGFINADVGDPTVYAVGSTWSMKTPLPAKPLDDDIPF
jgi:7-cyano-7-deazaguanine synthase